MLFQKSIGLDSATLECEQGAILKLAAGRGGGEGGGGWGT